MKKIIHTKCHVCSHNNFSVWGMCDGQTLYQCKNCELVFFFPYPTKEELEVYYNNEYHSKRGYGGEGKAGKLRKKMYKRDIYDLEQTISPRGRFLDVGCAEGVFLSMLSKRWDKCGIDISSTAIEKACQIDDVKAEVKGISDIDNNYFDVIHLRGVFEHILEPLSFIKKANRKLKMNGFLVLSNTPNIRGFVPLLFRGSFKLIIPNEHVNYFSLRTMRLIARMCGFRIKRIVYPYFGSPYCSFWKDILQIPFNLITGKISPPFWGNIFTLYLQKVKEI